MADRKSLGLIGYVMTGVTAAVIMVAVFVVQGHVSGRYALDQPAVSAATVL